MKVKTFEKNPMTGRLIPLILLGVIGYVAGVLVIVFEDSLVTGVAIIVATTIGEVILIADAVSNLSCPDCGERLHRDRKARPAERYLCPVCDTAWEMPPKSGG
jgi:predicted RNA-binding Zn-ribbon protein involved in translation (DUF1610 family)